VNLDPAPTTRSTDLTAGATGWQFWIDRGGTFTDVVALAPDGRLIQKKLLSDHPERYRDAAIAGIREILGLATDAPIPPGSIVAVKMGTTVGTNALLTRTGEPTLLLVTMGFADALLIGDQARPDIFALRIDKPPPLYAQVAEAAERLDAEGKVVLPLDTEALRATLAAARATGLKACAIAFLHSWRNPVHEIQAGKIARELGFTQITLSHQASPLIKFVPRAETAVLDAYLSPPLRRYVDSVADALLPDTRLEFMQSNGGLAAAATFQGKDSVLSGPAGGLIGMIKAGLAAGFERLIGFDMGGTSTDVSLYAGELERRGEGVIAGCRLRVPMLAVHTVAAGGGSCLHFDGTRLTVGPDSAGSLPGPLSYRRGGPLAVTDANLFLGRIRAEHFPSVFGEDADRPLDCQAVAAAFAELTQRVDATLGLDYGPEQLAEGFLDIAVENMADAVRHISLERGIDARDHTLVCFGGAAPQHACRLAERLGMARVLVSPYGAVLSAWGIGLAERRLLRQTAVEAPLTTTLVDELGERARDLADELAVELGLSPLSPRERGGGEGATPQSQDAPFPHPNPLPEGEGARRALLRYAGADTILPVPLAGLDDMARQFHERHAARFGFADPERGLICAALEVEVEAGGGAAQPLPPTAARPATPLAHHPVFLHGQWLTAPFYRREALAAGQRLNGPAVVVEAGSSLVLEPGWTLETTVRGDLLLTGRPLERRQPDLARPDPTWLTLFNRRFMSIAEDMGQALQMSARSVNIRERLDFSCALFDCHGDLVANAPHIPVHLGSMGDSVRAIVARFAESMRPGDAYLINSPYAGGTHLPDITVVSPVFSPDGSELRYFTASRAHHADVGGISPGSMPALSRRIEEEGCLSEGMHIVAGGRFLEGAVRDWLRGVSPSPPFLSPSPPTPTPPPPGGRGVGARNPDKNVADLRAQIAANTLGARLLRQLEEEVGAAAVPAYMGFVQANAEAAVRRLLGRLKDGQFELPLDGGACIRVSIRIDRNKNCAVIDFTGSSGPHPGNLNTPASIVRSAVLYVFRTLIDQDIPLNAGVLRPLEIRLKENSLLEPHPPSAVVAGNVETSQNLVDALYGALGVLAASQGTMNNLSFGDSQRQYYETLCGGAGAGEGFDGASAVHTHMTNSHLTDPEVLELNYPVRLERFAVRRGSGGAGRWRGGDGVVRRICFLAPMQANLLALRREVRPFGLAGGDEGQAGRQWIERAEGTIDALPGIAAFSLWPGDVLVLETPGGGGYGLDTQT